MKTLIVTAALVVLTTTAFTQQETSAKANEFVLSSEEISIAFYPNSANALTMILSKEDGQKVKVRLTDSDDKVLYSKRYSKVNNTKVKYDVSEFPSGEYTFEVVKGGEVLYTKNFTKREHTVALVD